MKKREKFAKEILDIACNGGVIAVTKDNKVVCCRDMNCEQCLFHKKIFMGAIVMIQSVYDGLNQNM